MYYNNNILVTHNDLDGIGCAVIGKLLKFQWIHYASYNRGKYYISDTVNKALSCIKNAEWLYLADISLSDLIWSEIKDSVGDMHVKLIDHHITSRDATTYNDKVEKHINEEISATKIFYELFKDECPKLVQYADFVEAVSAYDTWHFEKSPIARDLQRVYDCIVFQDPRNKYIKFNDRLSKITNYCVNDPIRNDYLPVWCDASLNTYNKLVQSKLNYAIDRCISYVGDTAFVMLVSEENIPMFEISWFLEEQHPEIKNVCYVLTNEKDGGTVFSLRTTYDDIDLSKFSEQYGGGGHAKAASIANIPSYDRSKMLDTIRNYFTEYKHQS